MAKKKEQLEEVVEETPEVVEESKDEPVTEAEKPVEVEETPEEPETIEEVAELEVDPEHLNREIAETKEELSVIKEVRNELVKLYSDYQESEKLKNASIVDNEDLKEQLSIVATKLQEYKVAEEQLAAEKQLQRLEKLSAKFTALGQSKNVEQLKAKDEETLSEFEKIVDAALEKVGETVEMPSVTHNAQTEQLNTSDDKTETKEVAQNSVEVKKEKLSDKDFFSNICGQLTGDQVGTGKKVRSL